MDKELDTNKVDHIVSAAKAGLGAVPVVGSLLAELVGNVIPNQRIDRLAKFAQELGTRLATFEQEKLAQKFSEPEGADLIEEGMRQAASSLSDERRAYIASLIEKSLTSEEISHQESKHLLKMLGDLNDAEIIWLRFYLDPVISGDEEFRERHAMVLAPTPAYIGSPQEDLDKHAISESYKHHLVRLGLLEQEYRIDSKTKQIKVDHMGRLETKGRTITPAGRLLLRAIGLA
jgi:hypothetical protein